MTDNQNPIDREEQHFADLLRVVEPRKDAPDRALLDRLKTQTTNAFLAAPADPADQEPPVRTAERSWLRRLTMNRTIRRLAVAAAIMMTTLGGFAWWGKQHSGVAFADVLRAVDNIRTVCFTVTIRGGESQPEVMKMSVLDQRIRQEMAAGIVNIIDFEQEKTLSLIPGEKLAVLLQVPGLQESGQSDRNVLAMLRECLHGVKGNAEDLGRRQIGGHKAQGFRANDDGRIVTLWVDVETALPLEAEFPWGDGLTTLTISEFEYGTALDESLFAMTAPPGYALLNGMVNLKDTSEQDLVQLLSLLVKGNDGVFPDSLALGSLQYDIGRAESKLSEWDQMQMATTVGRATVFLRNCHDAKYIGTGVALGESRRPVYRYRPKGSQSYRVIYGDLSIRDVTADNLSTLEKAAADPTSGLPLQLLERNRAAIDKLRTTLKQAYPHLLAGFDLDGELAKHRVQLECARNGLRFARVLQPILTRLHNSRITMAVGHEWITCQPMQENCSRDLLAKIVPGWHVNGNVQAGRFVDGIGYLAMRVWGDEQSDPNRRAVIRELANLVDAKALIIDLRGNGDGGMLENVVTLGGCFIDQTVVYGRETLAAVGETGEPTKDLQLEPNTGGPCYRGRVAVLIGPSDHGNTEWLAAMVKQVPGCVLVGEKTSGMLGTDETLDLGNGVTVSLPKYTPAMPDGTDISAGVRPDVEVKATRSDFDAGRDPVLEAALQALRSSP